MASNHKEIGWVIHLQCKQCEEFKALTYYYTHPEWYMWVLWRCRDCIKWGRKTEAELEMARVRDRDRYHNNPKRNKWVKQNSAKRRKEKWYWIIHWACARRIKLLWIRPTVCPICEKEHNRIEAHHFDYSQPRKIIFACKICHCKLDMWKLDWQEYTIHNIEPVKYKWNLVLKPQQWT